MTDIVVSSINSVYDTVDCDDSIAQEVFEYFSFPHPQADIIRRKVKRLARWNGRINLFKLKTRKLYSGLRTELELWAKDNDYSIEIRDPRIDREMSAHEAETFFATLGLPSHIKPYQHQLEAFLRGVRKNRALILSSTASGKSLTIYLLHRYWNSRTLVIVPTINLVRQMTNHFIEYGYDPANIHQIYQGQEKRTDKPITISTYHSIYELGSDYFNQFDNIIMDEVHHAGSADTLQEIMEKATKVDHRIGLTGTIHDLPVHKMILEGLFGDLYVAMTAADAIERGISAPVNIKILLLKYDEATSKQVRKMDYPQESEFIVDHDKRRQFIKNLVLSLKGNTVVLFRLVEKHGKILYDELRACLPPDRRVYFIYGGVSGDEREQIRQILATETDAVVVGSVGTVATGLDAPSLKNIVFTSGGKSKIKVLQAIGRTLRLYDNQDATVFDIVDDMTYKGKANFSLKHYIERVRLYANENFPYKIYKIDLYKK